MDRYAITDVRVFDGNRLLEPGTVVVDGSIIGTDPAGARTVDGGGGVLLPGLIDAHVHLEDRSTLVALARHGVTTAFDMGTWPVERVASLRGVAGLTDIRSSGVGAVSPTSSHAGRVGRPADALVGEPGQAPGYVAARVAEGVDHIKIIIDLPGFDVATVTALVEAAHAQGLLTIAHASTYDAVSMAQAAGVDVLTHVPLDRPIDRAAAERASAAGTVCAPTLTMMEEIVTTIGSVAPVSYQPARDSVATLHRAGVPILASTDANRAPFAPASPAHGQSLHHELELLVDAGLSTTEALRAATSLPAEHFGLTDRGAIAPGLRADLVLIEGDPVSDIRATRHVNRVWCGGVEVADVAHTDAGER